MNVRLNWLEKTPQGKTNVTFGVPWDKGVLPNEKRLQLLDAEGKVIANQCRRLAFWEDGSVKWSCHAASVEEPAQYYELHITGEEQQDTPGEKVAIQRNGNILIDTGELRAEISGCGKEILKDVYLKDTLLCKSAELVGIKETHTRREEGKILEREPYESSITEAVLEQNHPVRAVVKVTGRHRYSGSESGRFSAREWLPFTLRLYFYRNSAEIRGTYTFFYDGNPHEDIIAGLGLTYVQCMEGELHNRHIRIAGDTGYLTESPRILAITATKGKYEELLKEQLAGKQVIFSGEDESFVNLLKDSAVWDRYRLCQDSATHYAIRKRTNRESSWVKCKDGMKSNGFAYLGGSSGGISAGIRNFWQKYPAALDFDHISEKEAAVTMWFWSPYGEPMDMRHYDIQTHMMSAYEGYDEMRATPYGMANTSEFSLTFFRETPSHDELKQKEHRTVHPDRLVCTPQYYSRAKAFGSWQAAGPASELGRWFEEKSEKMLHLFKEQIETNQWYGFWNYGDIMRFYDNVRHSWKYDLGGCAWNNSELVPNMWMWYCFLHGGSSLAFEMAEAYTRHGSEVDQYHFGPYKGLGSRHNVVHWGCGCKEPRISMAGLNRFYYYLTGDERLGDVLDETADADLTTLGLDPLRSILPPDGFPTHARSAPDWSSYCSNWMTKWERYQDKDYLNKILKGLQCLNRMPYRLLSGPMFGYNPMTNELTHIGDANQSYHMCNCFGAIPVWLEMSYMLQNQEFDRMLEEYGAFYLLDMREKQKLHPELAKDLWGMPEMAIPVIAFAAYRKKDKELAMKVWRLAVSRLNSCEESMKIDSLTVPAPVYEVKGMDSETGDIYMNLYLAFPYLREVLSEEEMWNERK